MINFQFRTNKMKKTIKITALALCLVMLICAFAACAEVQPLMTYGEKTLSVNVYQFLLSRMKGTLGYYGYEVGSESFWKTVVDMQGTTYDQYFCDIVKEQAIMYLVADVMCDEQGLSLSAEQEAKIDEIISDRTPSVRVTTPIPRLWDQLLDQNFVPVVDDRDMFMGIVTRRSVMAYLMNRKGNARTGDELSS